MTTTPSNDILPIHSDIHKKLQYFIDIRKIPNIIFHGTYGCGKTQILNQFIQSIYHGDRLLMRGYVMRVNCARGKGIRFIREELKFFAKTNIDLREGEVFKTIVLTNADKLTIDAQSALRRCIELFSHSTRFFIVVEDKYKLLKPILSRFCEIYVPEPEIRNRVVNLHRYNIEQVFSGMNKIKKQRDASLGKEISIHPSLISNATITMMDGGDGGEKTTISCKNMMDLSTRLYEKGYSAIDLIQFIERSNMDEFIKYEYLITFERVRREFRNEKLLMTFILNFILFRYELTLENISFM